MVRSISLAGRYGNRLAGSSAAAQSTRAVSGGAAMSSTRWPRWWGNSDSKLQPTNPEKGKRSIAQTHDARWPRWRTNMQKESHSAKLDNAKRFFVKYPGLQAKTTQTKPRATTSVESTKTPKRTFAQNHAGQTHGGDDVHRVKKLVCDFSVTTNALGPVPSAVEATRRVLTAQDIFTAPQGGEIDAILLDQGEHVTSCPPIEHYPAREDPELTQLATEFLGQDLPLRSMEDLKASLLFGNGASELIDVLARAAPEGSFCTSPLTKTQYKEYEGACLAAGRQQTEGASDASLVCLVNPTNPTGDFVERGEMESWIDSNVKPGSWCVVDESMLFWAGPDWYKRGVSREFVKKMLKKDVKVFLVYSWTKIFSCTGLRIGSVVAPDDVSAQYLQSKQVPWSVNVMAREYLKAALQDTEYLERTWRLTVLWREHAVNKLKRIHPTWKFHGQPFTSWIWVDTGDEQVAKAIYETSLECGCPVRHAAAGYNLPTFIRIAVRRPYDFGVLYQALLRQEYATNTYGRAPLGTFADVEPSVIEGVSLVHIDELRPHEHVIAARETMLRDYVKDLPLLTLPAIVVDAKDNVLIDGHHRLELFRQAGMNIVPAVFVNYDHEDIVVNPPYVEDEFSKNDVREAALKGELLQPKSTQHMVRSRGGAFMPIIALAPHIAELRTNSA